MFKIGDYVTRKSYNNDIVFKIININNRIYYLKGICLRLYADCDFNDLMLYDKEIDDNFCPCIKEIDEENRNNYFYLPGKVLHIDGDEEYLKKCIKFYKDNRIKVYGFYMDEKEIANNILELLEKYKPDILVITGHDSFSRNKRDNYKNSGNYIDAVKNARKYENSHEKLIVIAGACQSNYEEIIKAGANFASSPKRINIHALDPAIIASCLAFADKNLQIDIINILEKTKYGSSGFGGIITKGCMYVGYPR